MTNKVVKIENGVTSILLDVSQTTATEADVASGKIFTKQDGTQGTGILEPVVEEIVGYEKTVSGTQVTFEKKGTTPEGETINATTDEEIAELLVSENVGKVLRFNGSSDTYVNGGYYLIESASKKITFNLYLSTSFESNSIQFFFNGDDEPFTAYNEYDNSYTLGTLIKNVNGAFTFKFWSGPNVISDARYSVDGSIPFDSGSGINIADNSSHYTQEVSIQPTGDMTINIVLDGYVD